MPESVRGSFCFPHQAVCDLCSFWFPLFWTWEVMGESVLFGFNYSSTYCSDSRHKNTIGPALSRGIKPKMRFQLWHACRKPCSSLASSSFLSKWTYSFFFLCNLSLPVTAHFNLLSLYHTALATFFWLNIEPCWSPPTQPTFLLFCITPSCSTRHGKMSRLLEEEALRRAFLLLVRSGAQ